jgi:hypothetical protein
MNRRRDEEVGSATEQPAAPNDDLLVAGVPAAGEWDRAWTVPVGLAWDEVVANYQLGWQRAGTDSSWEEVQPGYHYGYESAGEARYAGREFDAVEPELRGGYDEWRRSHGYPDERGGWERVREQVRESWERTRSGNE